MASAIVNLAKLALESFNRWRANRKREQRFVGVSVTHGEETVYVAWDGPLADIAENAVPRTLTPELQERLIHCIWENAGVQATLDAEWSTKGVFLYETDRQNWKRKLRGPVGPNHAYVLKVYP